MNKEIYTSEVLNDTGPTEEYSISSRRTKRLEKLRRKNYELINEFLGGLEDEDRVYSSRSTRSYYYGLLCWALGEHIKDKAGIS